MTELSLVVMLLTYVSLYVLLVYRAHHAQVGWLSSLLCLRRCTSPGRFLVRPTT